MVAAVLVWSGIAAIVAVQPQTVAPTVQVAAPPSAADRAEFYLKRGENYSGTHQYDRAIADYSTAIELKPDYAEAYNDRGFAFYLKGDAERAIADYTRAI
jgi:tetratricopeptide (TPR) repeat protein